MTLHRIDADSTTPVIASTNWDTWIVQEGVTLATSGSAIDATATAEFRHVMVEGNVVAEQGAGVAFAKGTGDRIVVSSTGTIASSSVGISGYGVLEGSLDIRNDGFIYGLSQGIYTYNDTLTLTNNGTISSPTAAVVTRSTNNTIVNNGIMNGGVAVYAYEQGATSITNTGTINGTVDVQTHASQANRIVNSGTITADYALRGWEGAELVINSGTMAGNVELQAGGDSFTNTGEVHGTVSLQTGDDVFSISAGIVAGNVNLGEGNDYAYLTGGSVNGKVSGGQGDDIYVINGDVGVELFEFLSQGNDTVIVDRDWHLDAGFDNLVLSGSAKLEGHGNQFANSLQGNHAANLLAGYEGDDILMGGRGGDRLDGGAGSDAASYSQSANGVWIDLAKGRARGGEAQGDTLVAIENVEGSYNADKLFGSKGANRLDGNSGDDRLDGRQGDDVLEGGEGTDTFVFAQGYGRDTIVDFESDPFELDVINLTGIEGIKNFRDLMRNHYSTEGDDAIFTFDGGDMLVLDARAGGGFTAKHFLI